MDGSGTAAERVLVTGGTGYLASWIIADLLGGGVPVRTTVRDVAKADRVRSAVAEAVGDEAAARLEVAPTDLLADDGWDAALDGVGGLVHTASPLGTAKGSDPIRTAREGVRRVLGAADRARVRRVVLTSSGVTAVPEDLARPAVETVWASPSGRPAQAYDDSKIFGERDAWAIAADAGFELTTVLPTFMQGPPLGRPATDGSTQIVRLLLSGGVPAIPRLGWDVVDVRDVARLHVSALTEPAAAGERFLGGSGTFLWWREMADILRTALPEWAARIPRRAMPDLLVRSLAPFSSQMAQMRAILGRKVVVDSSKARRLMGWAPTRSAEQTLVETARELLAKGVVG